MVEKIPAGREGVIPHLFFRDECAKAIDFYKQALGATEQCRMPSPDGRLLHAEILVGDILIMMADEFPEYCTTGNPLPPKERGTMVGLHRYVEDCDAAVKRMVDAGATVQCEPQDMFWGDRYGKVVDPFGHEWAFATHTKDLTAEEMEAGCRACFAEA